MKTDYALLNAQAADTLDAERWYVSAMSSLSALLMATLPGLNWAGFYFLRGKELVVGPYQGKPACIRIPEGKGVCGSAVKQDRALVVPNVHEFPGHIACDSASRSEVVVPIHANGGVVAVLDLDSTSLARFSVDDAAGLETLVAALEECVDW